MTDILDAVDNVTTEGSYHEARLLVLLQALWDRSDGRAIEGIGKVHALDFLLRYPTYLERMLSAHPRQGANAKAVRIRPEERFNVEASIKRTRYSTFDVETRDALIRLEARGAITIERSKAYEVRMTPIGLATAHRFYDDPDWEIVRVRADLLARTFDVQTTYLNKLIDDAIPEILMVKPGEEVPL